MIKKLMTLWNNSFAPKDWDVFGDVTTHTYRARRWKDAKWEYREATEIEAEEAQIWHAIK